MEQFLIDDTLMKKAYIAEAETKYNKTIDAFSGNHKKDYYKILGDQWTEIKSLISGTRTLTDGKAHVYLQKIVSKIVASNPELQSLDIRVFFSRDYWPNAYSMGDGTIAINAGLVQYFSTESELAFVLCHELAHYYLKHRDIAIKKYVDTINSKEFQKELKSIANQKYQTNARLDAMLKNFVFDNRKHSRDHESEADEKGLQFFVATGYKTQAVYSVMDILKVADDSILYQPLQLNRVFHFNNFPFNEKWVRTETSIFSKMKTEDQELTPKEIDSLKTHPDCDKRKAYLTPQVERYGYSGKHFIVDSVTFKEIKEKFELEMIEETYRQKQLSRNLYFNLLLLQENKHTDYAVFGILRCLTDIYTLQKSHTLGNYIEVENRYRKPEYNQLLRMLSRLKLNDIASIGKSFIEVHHSRMQQYEEWLHQYHTFLNLTL